MKRVEGFIAGLAVGVWRFIAITFIALVIVAVIGAVIS